MTHTDLLPRLLRIIVMMLSMAINTTVIADTSKATIEHIVEIKNFSFHPAEIDVRSGDTVTWINRDFVPHNVSPAGPSSWRSPNMVKGEMFSLVIDVGLPYVCTLHRATMSGTINTVDDD